MTTSSSERRAIILDKAAELLARKGVALTTVREIGDAAGILSGSLYHHFVSKDAIVDAIISDYLKELLERYRVQLAQPGDAVAHLRGLVLASLETVEAHPYATEIYQNDSNYLRTGAQFEDVREMTVAVRRCWTGVLQSGVEAGEFRSDIPVRVLYPLLRDGLWLSVRWFRPTPEYDRHALAEDCFKLFLEGISERAADKPARRGRRSSIAARTTSSA